MATLAHALLTALKDQDAHEFFGIPGDFVLPLFKVIEESNILPSFALSHEPAVGFAADASARYHGGLGVVVVTYGAGALNTVNSIAGAYAERSPGVARSRAEKKTASASFAWSSMAETPTWLSIYNAESRGQSPHNSGPLAKKIRSRTGRRYVS